MKMQNPACRLLVLVTVASVLFLSATLSWAAKEKSSDHSGKQFAAGKTAAEQFRTYDIKNRVPEKSYPVPRPPFSDDLVFPCTQCHDGKTVKLNTTRRKLEDMHDDILLKHGPETRWCLGCHSAEHRDQLHLADGTLIEFSRSFMLCGQCHGDKFRDWKVGVHGKRTGYWNGDKQYLLCVHCHNPHDPKFKPLKPLPPPERPGNTRR